MSRPRVVLLRGHSANPWELRAWELLHDRYDVAVAVTGSNHHDVRSVELEQVPVAAVRDRFPRGRAGDAATLAVGDRYRGLEEALAGADIVHSAELGVWFSGQPAALKRALGFKLVLTAWETIPFRESFRRSRGRRYRAAALAEADLYLAATDRARRCLLLEGAPEGRILVSPPGVDVERFARPSSEEAASQTLIVSPGRLVWEKGHFDVIRALALLPSDVRLQIVGAGPERERLLHYAAELGLAGRVEVRAVGYDEMPSVFAAASCVVLASLPTPVWEEQFGMVLAEAMAAGAPIAASSSGAIPEVLAGSGAASFIPGDWTTLADILAAQLATSPDQRVAYPTDVVSRYSTTAVADRLAAAYEHVLATQP